MLGEDFRSFSNAFVQNLFLSLQRNKVIFHNFIAIFFFSVSLVENSRSVHSLMFCSFVLVGMLVSFLVSLLHSYWESHVIKKQIRKFRMETTV